MRVRGLHLGLFLLLAACDEKAAAPVPAEEPLPALIDRQFAELQRLEAAHRAQQHQLQAVDAGAAAVRLVDDLSAELQLLGRVRKTLVTARSLPTGEGRLRIEKVMAEAYATRKANEASGAALEAEQARRASDVENLLPPPETETVE